MESRTPRPGEWRQRRLARLGARALAGRGHPPFHAEDALIAWIPPRFKKVKDTRSVQKRIDSVWQPTTVRKLARDLADIATDALLVSGGPVRMPGSKRIALSILNSGKRPN